MKKLRSYYYLNNVEPFINSLKGKTGEQGLKGFDGPPGDTGLKGSRGDVGIKGIRGPQGIRGIPGNKGDKGQQGLTGEAGDDGDKGIQGKEGSKGEDGLKGDKGDLGDIGDRGIQGLVGQVGDKGPQGESGKSFMSEHRISYHPWAWSEVGNVHGKLTWKDVYTTDPNKGGANGNMEYDSQTCTDGQAIIAIKSQIHKFVMKERKLKNKDNESEWVDAEQQTRTQKSRTYQIACAPLPTVIKKSEEEMLRDGANIDDIWNSEQIEYSDDAVLRYPFWDTGDN